MVKPLSSSSTSVAAEIMEGTGNDIPNWRTFVLPLEGDEASESNITQILQQRPQWSATTYATSLKLYDQFTATNDPYVAPGIQEALNVLDHAYRLYGPESVICSFNGGKDAVVILQLMLAAHAHYYRNQEQNLVPIRPRALYFEHADEFPEILQYLQDTVCECDLDFVAFARGIKFNEGLEVLVRNNRPAGSSPSGPVFPMAFVLGTRAGDPNAGDQEFFSPSSHSMPPFMRVNPVLEWNYGQVWYFLRLFNLKYCKLYDQGYTSLGNTKDTFPCPALAVPGSSSNEGGLPKFRPAYMLQDYSQERAGRTKKDKKSTLEVSTKESTGNTSSTLDNIAFPPRSV